MKPLLNVLFAVCGVWSVTASAQSYPSHPIKVVVPFPPGGYYDLIARVVGQKLSARLGQPVVVENNAGANGIIGTSLTAKAAPDGYTIMVGGMGTHAINPPLYPKLAYDPVRDFAPVILVAIQPNFLVVHPSLEVQSIQDIVRLARAKPGALSYASNGIGSNSHLSAELFSSTMGIKLIHVPYKGSGPALQAMLSGEPQIFFNTVGEVLPSVKAQKLRALAVTTANRVPAFRDIPTMAEAGVPNYQSSSWFAYFAPAGTPREIVAKLNSEIGTILKAPDVQKLLSGGDTAQIIGGPPEQLASHLATELAKWSKVVKDSGLKVE
jgi:tripartite-type tricarboxylate transporter receptor subunit TctC